MRAMAERAGRVVSLTTAAKLGSAGPYPVAGRRADRHARDRRPGRRRAALPRRWASRSCGREAHPEQARGAVTAIFLLNGLIFGSWAARIPAVRDRVGLSDGELGIVLACAAVGSIVAMPIAGVLAARIGSRRATRAAFALVCLATGLIALAPSLPVLCALAFFYGASMGVARRDHERPRRRRREALRPRDPRELPRRVLDRRTRRRRDRRLAAAADVDVRVQVAVVAVVSAVVGLTWSRRFLGADEDAMDRAEPVFVRPPRRLLALGALAFACLLIEGASADWSAVYLRDELGTTAAIAALGFTAFSVTMTLGRVFGDRLVDRFGPEAVVRSGGGLAAVGFGLSLLAAAPVRRDRGLRVPRRGDVRRRADRLPGRAPCPGHVGGRRARRCLEHRLPRLPRRPADHRRAGRALRAPRRPRSARRARRGGRAARSHDPRRPRRRGRRARARSRHDDGPLRPRRGARRLARVDHARLAWWGAATASRPRRSRPSSTAGRRGRSSPRWRPTSTPRPSRARSTCARPRTSTASSPCRAPHELFAGSIPLRS